MSSGGLCPSKSTVYVSNLPFSLTNSDLHKVFEKYGQVVKVTVVKDRERRSKGVAFVLFLTRDGAEACVRGTNGQEMFGRVLKSSVAKDNGRASEFIRRRSYPDKTRCYECGKEGHLSYQCPTNTLGERQPPKKRKKKKGSKNGPGEGEDGEDEEDEEEEEDSLSAAIKYQQAKVEEETYRMKVATGEYGTSANAAGAAPRAAKRIKPSVYFSDEEEEDD